MLTFLPRRRIIAKAFGYCSGLAHYQRWWGWTLEMLKLLKKCHNFLILTVYLQGLLFQKMCTWFIFTCCLHAQLPFLRTFSSAACVSQRGVQTDKEWSRDRDIDNRICWDLSHLFSSGKVQHCSWGIRIAHLHWGQGSVLWTGAARF